MEKLLKDTFLASHCKKKILSCIFQIPIDFLRDSGLLPPLNEYFAFCRGFMIAVLRCSKC